MKCANAIKLYRKSGEAEDLLYGPLLEMFFGRTEPPYRYTIQTRNRSVIARIRGPRSVGGTCCP